MRRIELNAALWSDIGDFYDALLPALGAPEWHGRNLDALWDSIASDEINEVRAPYEVCLPNAGSASEPLRSKLIDFLDLVEKAREHEGVDVRAIAEPPL